MNFCQFFPTCKIIVGYITRLLEGDGPFRNLNGPLCFSCSRGALFLQISSSLWVNWARVKPIKPLMLAKTLVLTWFVYKTLSAPQAQQLPVAKYGLFESLPQDLVGTGGTSVVIIINSIIFSTFSPLHLISSPLRNLLSLRYLLFLPLRYLLLPFRYLLPLRACLNGGRVPRLTELPG